MGRHYRIVFALSLTMALSGCWTADVRESVKKEDAAGPPSVTVATVGRRTVPVFADYTGQTQAQQAVDIKARVEGTLEKAYFEPGRIVKQNELLFQIDPSQYQAAVQSATGALQKAQADLIRATGQVSVLRAQADVERRKADLANAQAEVKRLTPLVKVQAVSQRDLDDATTREQVAVASLAASNANLKDTVLNTRVEILTAKAAVLSAEASLTNAKINLGYTTIRSPVTGVVGLLQVDPGNLVGRGDATLLTSVQAVDPIQVQFSITETDYLTIASRGYKVGSKIVNLILPNNQTDDRTGYFYALSNVVDPKTGTIAVQARFPNPDALLRPGQFTRVRVNIGNERNALVVPEKAIVELQGSSTVLIVDKDNKVVQRTVSLGALSGDNYVVSSGVKQGDRVVVEGLQKALPGIVVKPVEQTAQR